MTKSSPAVTKNWSCNLRNVLWSRKFGPKEHSMGKEENKSSSCYFPDTRMWHMMEGVILLTNAGIASCLIPTSSILLIFCQQRQINRKAFSWCPGRLQKHFTSISSFSEKRCVWQNQQCHGPRNGSAADQSITWTTIWGMNGQSPAWSIIGRGDCTPGSETGHWAHLLWPHPWHRLFSPSLHLFDWTTIMWQGRQLLFRNRGIMAEEKCAPLCA